MMANNRTSLCGECFVQKPTNNPGDGYIWVGFVVVLAIFLSNLIPLVVMARNTQLRKHRFFRFLICLSINAILTSPYLFTATVFRKITPMDDFSKLRIYFDCMLLQSYLHHGIIAVERLYASGSNFDLYRKYFTTWRQILYLALSYIIVGVFVCIFVGINYDFDPTNPLNVYGRKHDYILFIYGCIVLILLAIVTVLSSVCTYRVIKSRMFWKRAVQPATQEHVQVPSKIQTLKSSLITSTTEMPRSSTWVIPVQENYEKVMTETSGNLIENETVTLQQNSGSQPSTSHVTTAGNKNQSPEKSIPLTASKSKRSIAIIKTFLLVLFVVLCFNVPYWFTRVLIYLDKDSVTTAAYRVTFIITAAQYAMNPIIYFFRIEMFRKALICRNH